MQRHGIDSNEHLDLKTIATTTAIAHFSQADLSNSSKLWFYDISAMNWPKTA